MKAWCLLISSVIVLFLVFNGIVDAVTEKDIRHAEQTNSILDMLSRMENRLESRINKALEQVQVKEKSLREDVAEQKQEAIDAGKDVDELEEKLSGEQTILEKLHVNYTLIENHLNAELSNLNETIQAKLDELNREERIVDTIDRLVTRMDTRFYFPGGSRDTPATDCRHVMQQGHPSGTYWIRASSTDEEEKEENNGVEAYQVYCANNVNGGGWIMALNLDTSDGNTMWWGNPFWTNGAVFGDLPRNTTITGDLKSMAFIRYRGAEEIMIMAHDQGRILGWRSFTLASQAPLDDLINGGDNVLVTNGVKGSMTDDLPSQENLVRSSSSLILNHCIRHQNRSCTSRHPQGSDGDRLTSPETAAMKGGLGNWHRMGVCPKTMTPEMGAVCNGGRVHTVSEAQIGWGSCAEGKGYYGRDTLVPGTNQCQRCTLGRRRACYAEANGLNVDYAVFLR